MGISEINEIKTATNYVLESKNNSSAKNEIINLFSGTQFNNGGINFANTIENEVQTLQNFINTKNDAYENETTKLKAAQNELTELNQKLEDEIYEITRQADKEEKTQRAQIQNAINEVNNIYMNGDIEKDEMSSELAKKISKYSKLSSGINANVTKLSGTKSRISALTSKIASIIDSANSIESEINTASATLSIMQNLMSKMSISGSVETNESNTSGALGFVSDNKNYNFIIDANSDNTVNGESEFLGTLNGFEELKNLDKNNDKIIDKEELSANNMYVLMTDNQTGSNRFMSILESGISSINLSTITSESFNELEEPQVQNIFTVNTISGESVQGYENASVNGFDNTQMIVSIDESVLDNAKNIFSQSASLSDEGLEDYVVNAANMIKDVKNEIKKITNEMAANNSSAASKLTTQKRPETQKEREEREAEEAKKAEEEKKAQEEKEAEAAKKAEEEKKAQEKKELEKAKEAEAEMKAKEEKEIEEAKMAEEKKKKEEEKKLQEAMSAFAG